MSEPAVTNQPFHKLLCDVKSNVSVIVTDLSPC